MYLSRVLLGVLDGVGWFLSPRVFNSQRGIKGTFLKRCSCKKRGFFSKRCLLFLDVHTRFLGKTALYLNSVGQKTPQIRLGHFNLS